MNIGVRLAISDVERIAELVTNRLERTNVCIGYV